MKSYTDIEQSKKLAEILPLESADMYYPNRTDIKYQGALPIGWKRGLPLLSQEIPCWSLAVLVHYLSSCQLISPDPGEIIYYCKCDGQEISSNSAIDVCYEMILKLNEQKLL